MTGAGDQDDAERFDRLRRRVLWAMPTGLFVVGSRAAARRNLMTANWVMQVATSPKLVAVAVETGSVTHELIAAGGAFSVGLLGRDDRALVRRFVKPVREVEVGRDGVATALQGEPVTEVAGGLPVPAVSVAWIACDVRSVTRWETATPEGASHVLVVGEVVDAGGTDRLGSTADGDAVLTMGDTRMNYGG